jgi:hypothetical protein
MGLSPFFPPSALFLLVAQPREFRCASSFFLDVGRVSRMYSGLFFPDEVLKGRRRRKI